MTNNAASVRAMGVKKVGQLAASYQESATPGDTGEKSAWLTQTLIPKVIENYNID